MSHISASLANKDKLLIKSIYHSIVADQTMRYSASSVLTIFLLEQNIMATIIASDNQNLVQEENAFPEKPFNAKRNGWGGKRVGAGKKPKPKVVVSPYEGAGFAPAFKVIKASPWHGTEPHPHGYARANGCRDTRITVPITTCGSIPKGCVNASVYVGLRPDGRIKIGMSSDAVARCENLKIRLMLAYPVVPAAAKEVETHTLRLLNQKCGDGEVVDATQAEAIDAVKRARVIVGKYMHADPKLTSKQARLQRIGGFA